MPRTHNTRHGTLATESLVWLSPATGFLLTYLYQYQGNWEACIAHVTLVGQFFLFVTCIRSGLYRWSHKHLADIFGTALFTISFLTLGLYYVATLIGLDGWGKIISWALIETYLSQSRHVLESLGLNPKIVLGSLILGSLLLMIFFHLALLRKDGIEVLAKRQSTRTLVFLLTLITSTCAISIWRLANFPLVEIGEPFALTFHPELANERLQSHSSSLSPRMDQEEAAVREAYIPQALTNSANVILIVVDALRADHLSLNGYTRRTTPHLDSLFRSGRWRNYSQTYSVCAESSCGLMGLLSSRNTHLFVKRPITLQEVLRRHGYKTHFILGGDHTNFYGLRDAYGEVDTYFDASMSNKHYMNSDLAVVDRLSTFPHSDGRPTYFQFHLMSAHGLSPRVNAKAPFQPSRNYYADLSNRAERLNDCCNQAHLNFYDNGVQMADQMIEGIMVNLEEKGYLENAIIVITADHGEYLGENGLFGHAKGSGRPVLHIPLLIGKTYDPAWGGSEDRVISSIDIAPTITAALGISAPSTWQGKALQKDKTSLERAYFQQGREFGFVMRDNTGRIRKFSVHAGKKKFQQLYDLSADPWEKNNVLREHSDVEVSAWRRDLMGLEASARQSAQAEP